MAPFKMNKYIVLLLLSDVFAVSGFGLIEPIFALFVSEHVVGGSISSVGIAMGIFLVTKSLVQLPFSYKVDKCDDQHDIRWLLIGDTLILVAPIMFFFAPSVGWVYLAQLIAGIGAGLAYPSWLGLWSTHLDKNRESFEWSFYSTVTGIIGAITAVVGAFVAETYGFHITFLFVIFLALLGVFSTLYLRVIHLRRASQRM